ncbi:hypothetical protein BRADI_4g22572v3 [Brachypodium distachyon]|uniref:Zinc knuckle CX2CX4HX4C domain-containing protein n=1 Tax=Brachypodium distachyon TaxID=15368 RepID=A0A0Q3ERR2_BRADI|nr:hypothetical protein BRADI_4g22572v3 [Brachypodium distachyon]
MYQGPWLFRGFMIHSIPEPYRQQTVVDQLARQIGKVISVEMNPPKYFEGDYVRVRASMMTPTEHFLLDVKYEKLGFFCDFCGHFGHNQEECGDGLHDPSMLQYGKWFLAKRRVSSTSFSSGIRAPSSGRRGGRGGGRGRDMGSLKRSSQEADLSTEEELQDTGASPIKTVNERVDGGSPPSAQKKLDLGGDAHADSKVQDVTMGDSKDEHGAKNQSELTPRPPPKYMKPKDHKRVKASPSPLPKAVNDGSAASSLKDRRVQ